MHSKKREKVKSSLDCFENLNWPS